MKFADLLNFEKNIPQNFILIMENIDIFIAYSQADIAQVKELEKHLAALEILLCICKEGR